MSEVAKYNRSQEERREDAVLGLILNRPRMSWGEVAEALGYTSPRAAKTAFELAWQRRVRNDDETREWLRRRAAAQLESLYGAVSSKALDPNHPEQLAAQGRARELIADHRKLFGLDAPTEVNIGVTPSQQELENWVNEMKGTKRIKEADIFADYDDIEEAEVVEEPEEVSSVKPREDEIEF